MPTVAEAFASYRRVVIPDDASAVQVQECERAFYAGSYSMLMNVATSIEEDTPEEEGVAFLDALKAECEAYIRQQGREVPAAAPPVVEQHGYNVRSADVEATLRDLAGQIKPQVPSGFGFTLLIFSYGQTGLAKEGKAGSLFYISSARREDMVQAMKEFIARNTQ